MWYEINKSGKIITTSTRKMSENSLYTDEDIVVSYDGTSLVLVSETQTDAYKQAAAAYTEKKAAEKSIQELKDKLNATDYQAIKYAEGQLTEEEYAAMKAQRQTWRDQINALEMQFGITPINYMEGA